jgi:hypothetical protein
MPTPSRHNEAAVTRHCTSNYRRNGFGTCLATARVHQQILPRLEQIMRIIKTSSMFAVVFLGLFVSSARAQGVITATVPFPFVADHREFPAGRYEIRNLENAGTVLAIEGMNNKSGAFVFTMAAGGGDPAGNEPSLVFTHTENRYELSQIWESPTVGHELTASSHPHKVARLEAQPGSSQELAYVLEASWK